MNFKLFLIVALCLFVSSTFCQPSKHWSQNKTKFKEPKASFWTKTTFVSLGIAMFLIPSLVFLCNDDNKNTMIGGETYVERGSQTNTNSRPVTNQINLRYGNPNQDLGLGGGGGYQMNQMNQMNQMGQMNQMNQFNGPPQYQQTQQTQQNNGFYVPQQQNNFGQY
ncbi:shisa [Anaeramoeba flamelloides]|uniref:Shisa n=1 Tax=Anaeramoeba flamelloides TaxID=1746091 RepID=A0ABQ8X408_9EUKA|nr:shisa [Anaeramoeba flamelloides]